VISSQSVQSAKAHTGIQVTFVITQLVGVHKAGVTKVGLVALANTQVPVPVYSVAVRCL